MWCHSTSSSLAKVRECLGQRIGLKQVAPKLLPYLVKCLLCNSMWQAKHPNSTNFQPKYQRPHRSLSRIDVHLFWVSLKRQFPVAKPNKNKYYAPGKHPLGCSAATWLSNFFYISSPLRLVLGPLRGDFPSPLTLERNCKPNCWALFIPQLTFQRGPHKTRDAFWAASLADFAKYL